MRLQFSSQGSDWCDSIFEWDSLEEAQTRGIALQGVTYRIPPEEIPVNGKPAHYNQTKYEAWDVLDAWFPSSPLLWQAGKYLARAEHKGDKTGDLKKAISFIQREIDKAERD